jgi:L-aminopeptidase/D-esterase-like protein
MLDGDSIFGVSTGRDDLGSLADEADAGEPPERTRIRRLNAVLEAGAECFAAACTNAVVLAHANGGAPAYRDLCPSAVAGRV